MHYNEEPDCVNGCDKVAACCASDGRLLRHDGKQQHKITTVVMATTSKPITIRATASGLIGTDAANSVTAAEADSAYPLADLIVVCYSVSDQISLEDNEPRERLSCRRSKLRSRQDPQARWWGSTRSNMALSTATLLATKQHLQHAVRDPAAASVLDARTPVQRVALGTRLLACTSMACGKTTAKMGAAAVRNCADMAVGAVTVAARGDMNDTVESPRTVF